MFAELVVTGLAGEAVVVAGAVEVMGLVAGLAVVVVVVVVVVGGVVVLGMQGLSKTDRSSVGQERT